MEMLLLSLITTFSITHAMKPDPALEVCFAQREIIHQKYIIHKYTKDTRIMKSHELEIRMAENTIKSEQKRLWHFQPMLKSKPNCKETDYSFEYSK